jgi:hypothetical protein
MIRGLFKLLIFFLVAHALFRFVPPYWSHTRFESELQERVLTWRANSDEDVQEQILEMAQRHGVRITREHVAVRRERNHLFVDVLYERRIELFPSWQYAWTFESNVDAWMLQPRAPVP